MYSFAKCTACFLLGLALGLVLEHGGRHGRPAIPASAQAEPQSPEVRVLESLLETGPDWARLSGRVENVSGAPLEGVVATATFRDADGRYLGSESSMIGLDPLAPGAASEWSVLRNDLVAECGSATVAFGIYGGRELVPAPSE